MYEKSNEWQMAYIQNMWLLLTCMFSILKTDVDNCLSHILATDSTLLSFNIPQMKVKVIWKKAFS